MQAGMSFVEEVIHWSEHQVFWLPEIATISQFPQSRVLQPSFFLLLIVTFSYEFLPSENSQTVTRGKEDLII